MSIISPFYGSIDKKKYRFKSLYTFNVKMNWRSIPTEIMHVEYEGIDYYLVKNDNYFAMVFMAIMMMVKDSLIFL